MSHEHDVPAPSRRALRAQAAEPEPTSAAAALSRRELRALERAATAGAFEDATGFAPVAQYEELPRYEELPQHEAIAQYEAAAQYEEFPRYEESPQFQEIPQYQEIPAPRAAEPYVEPYVEPLVEPYVESYPEPDPLESGSLIMPAGHTGTGPVTPVEAYGRPAVLLDAPVQPALPPLDELGFKPEPWRTNVGLAEPVAVPGPRAVPADEELSTWVEEDLMDVDQRVETLAERLATLPVAPWAVDIELIEGGYVEHPCEPVDSVPRPHEPMGDRITAAAPAERAVAVEPALPVEAVVPVAPAVPAERAVPVERVVPVERAVPAPQPAAAPASWSPTGPAPTVTPSRRSEAAAKRAADHTTDHATDRAHAADRAGTGEHALPKASEHIPSVKPWVVPGNAGDPLAAMRRDPGPMLATVGAWLGAAAFVAWFLGPVALGIGAWTMNLARQHDYSRLRPGLAIAGGALGTIMGVAFVLAWH